MKLSLKSSIIAAAIISALSATTGCTTIANLESAARADRAENPKKYQEDPAILRQQMTANQEGIAFPQFCTWGCPAEQMDLTRNW